jgi:dihydropteroate synthase
MFTLNCKGRLLVVDKPILMGIINITPDSFFEKSRLMSLDLILEKTGEMIEDGVTILDIGGQSTRPGSERLPAEKEIERIIAPIDSIRKNFPDLYIAVDTYYAEVAKEAVRAGASIVNDISSGSLDKEMLNTVADLGVPYIIMHMQGTPETMQKNPVYKNVTTEVFDFLNFKIGECKKAGIDDVIIDPGFGFGKTVKNNFQLLHDLSVFTFLSRPVLAGVSRKSFIYKTLNTTADDALNGTTVLNTIALMNGALILRVHDVKEAAEAIKLFNECYPKEKARNEAGIFR